MTYTLSDLREGRVTPEAFLASRNNYKTRPTRTHVIEIKGKTK